MPAPYQNRSELEHMHHRVRPATGPVLYVEMHGSVARIAVMMALASAPAYAQAYDDPETERMLCKLDGSCPKAEVAPSPTTTTTPATTTTATTRPFGLALARHALVVTLTAEASVGRGTILEPLSLAPDVAYGVTDRVTLSLVHSGFATTGFRGNAGGGLCLAGGCARVYNNAGAEALIDVVRGRFAVAAVAGLHALSFEPTLLDVAVGARAAYHAGAITATLSPSLFVGLTERDRGNEGTLFVPASLGAQVSRRWFAALGGGVAAPLAEASGWTARLGAIARFRIRRDVFVAGSLFLPKLAGGSAVEGTGGGARVANLWVTFAR